MRRHLFSTDAQPRWNDEWWSWPWTWQGMRLSNRSIGHTAGSSPPGVWRSLGVETIGSGRKRFKYPSYDRAYIYVYRDDSICCIPSVKVDLQLDGALAVHLSDWTFALLPVRPGVHALTALGTDPSELRLNVIGGQVVYVRLHVDAGRIGIFIVRVAPDLQRMDRDEGREGGMDCRLIAQPSPALPQAGAAEPQ
jgi:hypothetical protein